MTDTDRLSLINAHYELADKELIENTEELKRIYKRANALSLRNHQLHDLLINLRKEKRDELKKLIPLKK